MTTAEPLVSVLMCNYNYGRYIEQAMRSVLSQTYGNFELIVVDDGSVDESRAVIESVRDPRIRIVFKENGGQASAFNAAFLQAQGELIAFLDSDDWWLPQKLSVILRWHEFLGEQYGIIQHNVEVVSDEGRAPLRHVLPVGDCLGEMLARGDLASLFVPTSGIVMKRSVAERVLPMPEEFTIAADAFIVRAAPLFGRTYSVPDSLGCYRLHKNAVFKNESFDHWNFNTKLLIPHLEAFFRKHDATYRINYEKMLAGQFARPPRLDQAVIHRFLMRLGLWGFVPMLARRLKGNEKAVEIEETEKRTRRGWALWREWGQSQRQAGAVGRRN